MKDSRYSVIHSGHIEDIAGSTARVAVATGDSSRSCAGCALEQKCGSSASAPARPGYMLIDAHIPESYAGKMAKGDKVRIGARKSTVLTSVLLLVVLPLASLIMVMAICLAAGFGDDVAGVVGLAVTALAFGALYLWGRKSSGRPVWTVI